MKARAKAERFFTEDEKERLKAVTRDVESRSLGEIVVVVVDRSDHYMEAEVLGAVVLGSLLSLVLTLVFFHASLWSYLPLSFLFFFAFWQVFKSVEALKRHFVGLGRREEAVTARAERAFFEHGLYRTKKNTGVLFLLSLFEKKVRILADRGIYEKMAQDDLNRFAVEISKGVREGRACDALTRAIQSIGALLSTHFPATADDTNELPDGIIAED
jgi:putative membrane protein